jgi:adenosylcobinamide-phosphate synthase
MSLATAAIAVGFALDLTFGELPNAAHPVAWFGYLVDRFDRVWSRPLAAGLTLAAGLPVFVATGTGIIVAAIAAMHPWLGASVGGVVVFVTTSFRSLLATVRRVGRLAERDLAAARSALGALAGREAAGLDAGRVRSAAVESLAENLSDGLVAPLLAFGVCAGVGTVVGLAPPSVLALACAGASWLKAVDTLDSMWGYPDRPLGTGAARLDDLAMWLPARITAALLAVAMASPRSLHRARGWLDRVASPNAGWPMGVLAVALDVRLDKPGHYALNEEASLPDAPAVARAHRGAGVAGLLAYLLAGVLAWS